ncbi:MAG: HD domain-containing protein [Eubacterium sp.]|jgi:Guanosine polyphosphate pyrophosphohydrolases/synthetases|nr:HD domain-containing protein [Eubacterium sp.]
MEQKKKSGADKQQALYRLLTEKRQTNVSYRIFHEEHLWSFLEAWIDENQALQSKAALEFAKNSHQGQVRSKATPYVIHPLTVACHAIMCGIEDDNTIATMLLHDVCEDCFVRVEELPVNSVVKEAVRAMTFTVSGEETKEQAKQRYYKELLDNKIAAITKIFDRCNNVSEMAQAFDWPRMERYIAETRKLVLPLLEKIAGRYEEYSKILFLLKYQILSVIDSVEILIF